MKITFDKLVQITIDVEPSIVAELAVEDYTNEYPESPLDSIFTDWVSDNLETFILAAGVSRDDIDAISDLDYDVLSDLDKAITEYLVKTYNIEL